MREILKTMKLNCRAWGCTKKAETEKNWCAGHRCSLPEIARPPRTDRELSMIIEEALERPEIKELLLCIGGHYGGISKNGKKRRRRHKRKTGCSDWEEVMVCRDAAEASRAEALLVAKLVKHKDVRVRNGVCNEKGGGFTATGVPSQYVIYILAGKSGTRVPGTGKQIRHPLRTMTDPNHLQKIANNCYNKLLGLAKDKNCAIYYGVTMDKEERTLCHNRKPYFQHVSSSSDTTLFESNPGDGLDINDGRIIEMLLGELCLNDESPLYPWIVNVTCEYFFIYCMI